MHDTAKDVRMSDKVEGNLSGALIIAAVLGTWILMLHHPTSFQGQNDGLLLNDWSNQLVHGAMIICLFMLRFAFSTWARLLGADHAWVRAGTMSFDGGMTAFIGAALISGFAASGLVVDQADPDAIRLQLKSFVALNRALANLGMVLVAAAMPLWAVRMLPLKGLTRIAGAFGVLIALIAVGWLVVGQGAFDLYPATVATLLFGAWSLLIALQMIMRGGLETHND
jgi:hypothetical protein